MLTVKTKGLILKQSDFGETNRVLTVFTKEFGIIRACAYGAKSIRNKNSASTQVMTYAEFLFQKTNKDMMSVRNSEIIDSFFGVKEDIVKLSLCVYFADLVYALLNTNSPDEEMLALFLNALYALSYKDADMEKMRTVFELKAMSLGGYMPNISCCTKCGTVENIFAFSPKNGGLVCRDCSQASDILIDADVYNTIRYILLSDSKKMLSFSAAKEVMERVSKISEKYVGTMTEKEFKSLDYYKKMMIV